MALSFQYDEASLFLHLCDGRDCTGRAQGIQGTSEAQEMTWSGPVDRYGRIATGVSLIDALPPVAP